MISIVWEDIQMSVRYAMIGAALLAASPLLSLPVAVAEDPGRGVAEGNAPYYDEAAYTEYVQQKMKRLDQLYLDFCASCNVDPDKAAKARKEFLVNVRELMQYMNGRFDALDPKAGAALSGTETLVSIHALTMLVDILTATQIEEMTPNPHIN